MNMFAWIILVTLLFQYALNLVSDILNLKAMSEKIPDEFRGFYDSQEYEKSQRYTREKTRFGFVTHTFDLALILGFWFLGGFNDVDGIVRNAGYSPIITGIIYIGALVILNALVSLPFQIYSTFVIEEKYGFNRTTVKTYVSDLLKGLALAVIIGVPLLYMILWFFENTGSYSWLYIWVGITLISLLLQFIAPVWIMPLFNKFKPMEDGELKSAIMKYAKKVSFALKDVFVMDGSKRSSKANAFFTGFGKNKRVALFDTLIEKQSTDELVSVLAHEVGHYKKKHIVKGMITSVLHTGVLFYLMGGFIENRDLFDAFFMEHTSIYASLIFFTMLFSPVEMILSMVMAVFSRKHEYEADRYAAETIQKPDHLISSLKKLSVDHLSNLTPHPLYVFLHYSHPPILSRVNALRSIGEKSKA
ncbi:MAG: M48 family metallopeptidase [Spirochaetia bacterium]|nr:M48 family metallopeptidase [Spirochaetia bacterium]